MPELLWLLTCDMWHVCVSVLTACCACLAVQLQATSQRFAQMASRGLQPSTEQQQQQQQVGGRVQGVVQGWARSWATVKCPCAAPVPTRRRLLHTDASHPLIAWLAL